MKLLTSSLLCLLICCNVAHADDESEFSSLTLDLGCVVSDIDASVRFYTEAIGFKRAGGFKVDADFADDAGLTNQPLDIKVLVLGTGEGATKLKLMQAVGSKKAPNERITTTLGFSYLTVFVKDTEAAVKRLTKAGVKPIAKGPVALPGAPISIALVRDPDGNFVELVGPTP